MNEMKVAIKSDPKDWIEFVLERFVYNFKSATVHWKSSYSEDGCGSVITGGNCNGYKVHYICGKLRYMQQVVWILTTGKKPELDIDHINGDRANNAHWNLREVDHATNLHNTTAKGYCLDKATGRWRAGITINYKLINLGRFDTEQEARAAYEAAKKLHGLIHR